MGETINFEDFGKKRSFEEKCRDWFYDKWYKTKRFVKDNKEILIVTIPVAGSLIMKTISVISKHGSMRKEKDLKELYVYDKSRVGHYWKLRRPLSTNEWIEVETRRNSGEALGHILDSMRVLA